MADRKKHKAKLAQRKTMIAQAKNSYKKFMQKQIDMIQEQMKQNASKNIDHAITNPDIVAPTQVTNTLENVPNIMLAAEVNRLEQKIDAIK